jgi:hypothetical protein
MFHQARLCGLGQIICREHSLHPRDHVDELLHDETTMTSEMNMTTNMTMDISISKTFIGEELQNRGLLGQRLVRAGVNTG